MRYLLDSDSIPNKWTDLIWLLNVPQPRYDFPPAQAVSLMLLWSAPITQAQGRHIPSAPRHFRRLQLPLSASTSSYPPKRHSKYPGAYCLPEVYADVSSRVCVTYRSHFYPIETRRPPSSNSNWLMPLLPTSQYRSPPVLPQNVGGPVVRRNGRVTLFAIHANRSIVTCDSTRGT